MVTFLEGGPMPQAVYLLSWAHSALAAEQIARFAGVQNTVFVLFDAGHVDVNVLPAELLGSVCVIEDNSENAIGNLPTLTYAELARWLAAGVKCVSWL